jgi:hypothetical protein
MKCFDGVWMRLRDRLSLLDSSTSLVEVTTDYAANFYDMYVEGHTGKHLTGDQILILLLNLPFLFCDLLAPEVKFSLQYSISSSCKLLMACAMISCMIYNMISCIIS